MLFNHTSPQSTVSRPRSESVLCTGDEANLLWANLLIGSIDYPSELWDVRDGAEFCAGKVPLVGLIPFGGHLPIRGYDALYDGRRRGEEVSPRPSKSSHTPEIGPQLALFVGRE